MPRRGAERHTNNTAELTSWLLADAGDQPVLLRPDSTYVWDLVTGVAHASCNLALVRRARELYASLREQRGGRVGWAKVAAHADGAFPWNERVDTLAARGAQCEAEAAGGLGADWAAVRLDGPLHPLCAMRARWAAVRVVVTRARGLLTVAEAVTWAGAEEWHVNH